MRASRHQTESVSALPCNFQLRFYDSFKEMVTIVTPKRRRVGMVRKFHNYASIDGNRLNGDLSEKGRKIVVTGPMFNC